ncbi:MAG: glutamyl-tRNA reductase [Geodermatophilaceae bacterium]|nr:glutamyl-tRNA reductase [Geodermatophilaceae bacterium]
MSLLVIGVSHRSAPLHIVERAAVPGERAAGLLRAVQAAEPVSEALLLSTCNRVEVYAEVNRFHAAVTEIGRLLAEQVGIELAALADHLYVHYDEPAVSHLFNVAAGLDSMVVGETQVLGQLRAAYGLAQAEGTIGRRLHAVVQRALRTGRRVQAETGIALAGASLVSVALDEAEGLLSPLSRARTLIVGAGSMGALAGVSLRRRGVTAITVTSRTREHAAKLAATLEADSADLATLARQVAAADLVVTCTGAAGTVLDTALVAGALADPPDRRLVILDLALPRDVALGVGHLDRVDLLDLARLQALAHLEPDDRDLFDSRAIVTAEVAGLLAEQRADEVAPLISALRGRARDVVDGELRRVAGRLPGLDPTELDAVENALRRVADKLLHQPTVRIKELVAGPAGASYTPVLRALLGLDAQAIDLAQALSVDASLPDQDRPESLSAILQDYRA